MNGITQHIPGFCDFEPNHAEFDTLAELLALDWVDVFAKSDFHQWSLSGNALMAESDKGHRWWVVGYIARPDLLDLPSWASAKVD